MRQDRTKSLEKFKPKVMDLHMLSSTDVDGATVYEMNMPYGNAKMISHFIFDGVELTFQEVSMKEIKHQAKPLEGMF